MKNAHPKVVETVIYTTALKVVRKTDRGVEKYHRE